MGGEIVAGRDYSHHRPGPWYLLCVRQPLLLTAAVATSPCGERRSGSIVARHNMIDSLDFVEVFVFVPMT
jgi:hypothetical protein